MIKQYLTSIAAFVVLDGIWLGIITPKFYRTHIGHLMSPQADFKAAIFFYVLFLIGLNVFVITPQRDKSILNVAKYGALFGLVTYATFDLTSVAVFREFPYLVAGVDMIWGATLCAAISVITVWMTRAK
jgi:uncharacterized membrane protein